MENNCVSYPVVEKYKESGQRQVFRIIHPEFGECIMKKGKCLSNTSLERIKREVSILREIDSAYFPKNYQANYFSSGEFIIFEEYIKSKTLSEFKEKFKGDEEKVFNLFINIINGLEIIWKKRIVHRDLKPDNILILSDGRPVIIDLGIARMLEEKSLTLTIQQNGPCTPVYASPEQISNKKNSIDIRSDFYSLAIIIAELILGEHPFSTKVVGQGMSTFENLLNNRYKLKYENIIISDKAKRLIDKLLQKEPYQRVKTVKQLREKINEILF
ncbi:serine/threonine protein kinase [Clostridium sp. PL3]|uniref:Serine/threonine protein kinase n=1 Tax=Clostridium thailandense TaxID=2794346 RepID=A0A949TZD2_9CLOT|nr:serine/threonine-protein kinase [Clostridium thailandense]MBV7276461.1 serine/threonine protein kinase [Clostridium thailandense]